MARKNKYIAHLAEFFFEPKFNWSIEDARSMYEKSTSAHDEQVLQADCIQGMRELPSELVDLVIADPPFGIDFSGKESIYNRKSELVAENYADIVDGYAAFSSAWIEEITRLMKPEASAYIFSGFNNLKQVLAAIDEAGLIVKNHVIWHYNFGVFTRTKFVTSHYHVLFVVKDPAKYFYHRIEHYVDDVWDINRAYSPGKKKNGTKLPEEVVRRCIDYSSKPGYLVFDPFLGNGTTAVVAKKNFRHYMGFEINKTMMPIIQENIDTATLGESYVPYKDRLKTPEELKDIDVEYARAYREYLKVMNAKGASGVTS